MGSGLFYILISIFILVYCVIAVFVLPIAAGCLFWFVQKKLVLILNTFLYMFGITPSKFLEELYNIQRDNDNKEKQQQSTLNSALSSLQSEIGNNRYQMQVELHKIVDSWIIAINLADLTSYTDYLSIFQKDYVNDIYIDRCIDNLRSRKSYQYADQVFESFCKPNDDGELFLINYTSRIITYIKRSIPNIRNFYIETYSRYLIIYHYSNLPDHNNYRIKEALDELNLAIDNYNNSREQFLNQIDKAKQTYHKFEEYDQYGLIPFLDSVLNPQYFPYLTKPFKHIPKEIAEKLADGFKNGKVWKSHSNPKL